MVALVRRFIIPFTEDSFAKVVEVIAGLNFISFFRHTWHQKPNKICTCAGNPLPTTVDRTGGVRLGSSPMSSRGGSPTWMHPTDHRG